MLSVYQTLSVRYLTRHWLRAVLIVASIALGVGTLVATQALNETMTKATYARINPMPSVADLVVSNDELLISSDLAKTLKEIDGVEDAQPRIFDNVRIPELEQRSVLLIGIETREHNKSESLVELTPDQDLLDVVEHAQQVLVKQFKSEPKFGIEVRETLKRLLDKDSAKLLVGYLNQLESGQGTNEAAFDIVQRFLPPVMVGTELMDSLKTATDARKSTLPELFQALDLQDDIMGTLAKQFITSFSPEFKEYSLKVLSHLPAEFKKDKLKELSDVKMLSHLSAQFKNDPLKVLSDANVLWRLSAEFKEDILKVMSHRFAVQKSPHGPSFNLLRVGRVTAKGDAAALGGNVLILDIRDAARILAPRMKSGQVNRIDITLKPGCDKEKTRAAITLAAKGKGEVRTPAEHGEAMGNALSGMKTGFSLCGLAALVVGLFLVYNALSVCVAERRHEIGVLLSLGATQRQVRMLFAGEAAFLGLLGSLLGIPLGIGLANLGLQPVQEILAEIFVELDAKVETNWWLIGLAMSCGVLTSIVAGLVPAVAASRENPASAVRQVSKAPTWSNLSAHIVGSLLLIGTGVLASVFRDDLRQWQEILFGQTGQSNKLGTFGGMMLVLLGALLAAPLLAAVIARMIQPLARRCFPITWRLAADNLVLAPGRTGLVIAALAAGVALVVQTYGISVSNSTALRKWVQESIAADLIVTSGSPIGAGGTQSELMAEAHGDKMRKLPGVEAALPSRRRKMTFRKTSVLLFAMDAGATYEVEKKRHAEPQNLDLYKMLSERPDTVIVSENFSALHGLRKGDFVPLNAGANGETKFLIIGTIEDYNWNHGTIFINRDRYKQLFNDSGVELFDVFVERDDGMTDEQHALRVNDVKQAMHIKIGEAGLVVLTRKELQDRILKIIDQIYAIALVQQFVVMFVAALGVVMALLISVLQRRREMGLLRAIGASRTQVIRSVLAEACLMGVIGTIIGIAVGIPLQWYVQRVVILEESGYLFPVYIPWLAGLVIAAAAMSTATLAGLGPALHSVRMRIPEAIAYE